MCQHCFRFICEAKNQTTSSWVVLHTIKVFSVLKWLRLRIASLTTNCVSFHSRSGTRLINFKKTSLTNYLSKCNHNPSPNHSPSYPIILFYFYLYFWALKYSSILNDMFYIQRFCFIAMFNGLRSRVRLSGFGALSHVIAVWFGAIYCTYSCLSFLICKIEIIIIAPPL